MYQNYIFDLYGTLVDLNTDEGKEELWIKLSEFYSFQGAFYKPLEIKEEYKKICSNEIEKNKNIKNYEIDILNVFRILYNKKGIKADDDLCIYTGQFFRITSTQYIKLYNGVLDLFEKLREKEKNIYLLSNAQHIFTVPEMKMLGIYDLFDGIVLSSDEGIRKPSANFYDIIIKRYNLKKSESIMIGNDYMSDIEGSYKAGIDSLYIETNISPKVKGKLYSKFNILDGNIKKIERLLLK
ncbi:HAD family hydrolase [Clostridium sp. BJN0001]|uniref:HAD family hydrolase n=1 Tax=Clostridium sp. BJN0001 TaxID=2930219 RepID=UPI001FD3407D|nr:HAD family hydrolase [Clostridium sp. BJN0001]